MALLPLDDTRTRSILDPVQLIAALRQAFIDLRNGDFELPQRVSLADSRYLVMPTRHRPSESLVVKTLSLVPGRSPMISGLVSWSTAAHDLSVVAPAETITALRTGAITGLATDLLADRSASSLVIFGAGALAVDQVRFVHAVRPLRSVAFVARTPTRAAQVIARLRPELPDTEFLITTPADRELTGADIVCCATTSQEPLFAASELGNIVHINAVGSYRPAMHEFGVDLIGSAAAVVVDDLTACMVESGELIDGVRSGAVSTDRMIELVTIVDAAPRPGGRTIFKSVGIAIQDWAAMHLLARAALSA